MPTTEFDATVKQDFTQQPRRNKLDKILNVLLVAVLIVLVTTVVVKAFFVTNVVVSGDSMFPTYTNGAVVKVDRNASEKDVKRGDVVVFYLNNPSWFKRHFDFFPKMDGSNDEHRLLIKRVVAIQGEQIWVEQVDGKYKVMVKTLDGQIVGEWYASTGDNVEDESIIDETQFYISPFMLQRLASYTKDNPYTIPQGHFFAMGDNRDVSHDSRANDIGDIPYQNIFGKVMN
ncbi:MAG: signal peptidase I [Clostridia bacterium]|nr:signal peptidase I [Clostridia bacterium]